MTVLATAIGSFSGDIVIKSLRSGGMRIIGCDIYPKEWIADSGEVDAFYQVPYASEEEDYVDAVLKICMAECVDSLIVLTDVEVDVWNRHRGELEKQKILLCLPPEPAVSTCRDKLKFYRFLKDHGFEEIIPTLCLSLADIEKIAYPAVCKPYNGRSSEGLQYIRSPREMQNFLSVVDADSYIVQPFYSGAVVTVDIVRHPSGASVCICRQELLRTKNGAGTSVMTFRDQKLENICRRFAEELGIIGCVNVEFIRDVHGGYHMLECNPRFSGGVKFSHIAGYDCVTNHLRCFDGETIEAADGIHSMNIARKYEEYITRINE